MELDNKALHYVLDGLEILAEEFKTILEEDLDEDEEAEVINDLDFVEGLIRGIDDHLKLGRNAGERI